MNTYEVTIRNQDKTTIIKAIAKHPCDAASNVLHALGDMDLIRFALMVKPIKTELVRS
jgi:hypothetical protein